MEEKQHQETLTKMLGLAYSTSEIERRAPWPEIYEAIGALKERAKQRDTLNSPKPL